MPTVLGRLPVAAPAGVFQAGRICKGRGVVAGVHGGGRTGRAGGAGRFEARALAKGPVGGVSRRGEPPEHGEQPEPYVDNVLDSVLVEYFRGKVEEEVGRKVPGRGYDAVCDMTHVLNMQSATPEELQVRGTRILRALLPQPFPHLFGLFLKLFPKWFDARHAAASVPLGLPWLVGKGKIVDVDPEKDGMLDDMSPVPSSTLSWLTGNDYKQAGYKQAVLVERCRLLDGTKCASVCVNVCKVPTQAFFNEDVGLPLTMVPNYETMECRFIFGKTPPPPEEDPSYDTPCLGECPSVRFLARMEEDRKCRGIDVEGEEGGAAPTSPRA